MVDRKLSRIFILLIAVLAVGCEGIPVAPTPVPLQPLVEIPGADLPASERPRNWTDSRGSGSCVIASSVYNSLWAGLPDVASHLRKTYAGGQTDSSIREIHDRENLGYYFTRNADTEFLRWVTDTRRSALIWYYQSHCVNFVGFHRDPTKPTDPTLYAWLCDNNRPSRFIRVPADEFARKWAGYGGFGLSLASPPVPPPLFDALRG